MTIEEVEKILGRPLREVEKPLFKLYKDNPEYTMSKDRFGNLKIEKKET